MPDLCSVYTLDLATDLKMNGHLASEGIQDTLIPLSIKGLHGRPIRSTIIPRGATNGGRKLTSRFGPRAIVVQARVHIVQVVGVNGDGFIPASDMTEYLTRVNALLEAWEDGLEAVLNTPFNLSWTPTGGALKTLSVTYGFQGGEFEMTSEGESAMIYPTVTFGLVAETG